MSFVSFEYIALLLISTLLYFIVPKKYRFVVLIIANIVFYVYATGFHALYLLASIISVYLTGLYFNKMEAKKSELKNLELEAKKAEKKIIKRKKRIGLIITILFNVGILLILKYNGFFIGIFNGLFNSNFSIIKFILPLGISYYTLMDISYIVDIYNGKYEGSKNFFKVFLYLSFFPLMVEGPIAKFDEIGNDLIEGHDYSFERMINGFLRIIWGFIKKLVIADRVGLYVDAIFQGGHSGIVVFAGVLLYVLQIYSEFSGCMDIVIGTSNIFGISLPENFKEPFFSKTVNEFWRRWHITLGRWLKDYIFYPISLSKANMKLSLFAHKKMPKFLVDFITMGFPLLFVWILMGFWHGASWKYILYGLYYYIIIMLGILFKPVFNFIIDKLKIKTECFSYHLFQSLRTFIFIVIGMTIFRASTLTDAFNVLGSIFTSSTESIASIANGYANVILIVVCIIIVLFIDILKYKGKDILQCINNQNLVFRYLVYLCALIFLLIFGIYGYGYNPSSFIYGEF